MSDGAEEGSQGREDVKLPVEDCYDGQACHRRPVPSGLNFIGVMSSNCAQCEGGYASRKEFNNRKAALIETICGIAKPTLTTVIFGLLQYNHSLLCMLS